MKLATLNEGNYIVGAGNSDKGKFGARIIHDKLQFRFYGAAYLQ